MYRRHQTYQKYLKYKKKYLAARSKLNLLPSISNDNVVSDVITNDNLQLIPKISYSHKLLTFNFPEVSIASVEYAEGPTGCTYIRFNVDKTTFHVDARGGAVTTYAADLTRNDKRLIRGICFSGGSILGMEAKSGCVIEEIRQINYSNIGKCHVTGATLRSANLDYNRIYPDKNLGRFAVKNVTPNQIYLGQVGVGCMAGDGFYGQGAAYEEYHGVKILVVSGVNALGVLCNEQGQVVRDRWKLSGNNSPYVEVTPASHIENTTLTAVITNLSLNAIELEQLAVQCHTNLAVVIRPFNTIGDGDVLFSVTLHQIQKKDIPNFSLTKFYDVCSQVTKCAILSCYEE